MKQLCIVGIALLLATPVFSRVYTVNNQIAANDAGKYLYKNITDAHNAATAGDTLYVLGSAIEYSASSNITKKLTIIGPGYYLGTNATTQFNNLTAYVYSLAFKAGSEGSKVMGVCFYNNGGGVDINTNQITVERCWFGSSAYVYIVGPSSSVSLQSIVVSKCYFDGTTTSTTVAVSQAGGYPSVAGLLFANNICLRPFALKDGSTATIVNNTFVRNTFDVAASTITMTNNILMGTNKTIIGLPTNTGQISYNIAESDVFGTTNGNKAFATQANLFVATGTTDGMWQTATTGPAHLAGLNSKTMGAFGGDDPYRLSGLPPIPAIYQITTTGMGTKAGGLTFTVKAKTN